MTDGGMPRLLLGDDALVQALRDATAGEYELGPELGRGGMASVFLARDVQLDRPVAIKVASPALMSDAQLVERFKREARTAAALTHPGIIPIHAVRERPPLIWIVMRYISGPTLGALLARDGALPVPLALCALGQAAEALAYAHERGVVHRDVKPANMMLDRDGTVIVTDFGIAKAGGTSLTGTGMALGTPTHMSPEQSGGREVTAASDQYALGVVAYELLAGSLPFEADSVVSLIFAHHQTPPRPLESLRPDLPPAVVTAVARMLAKDPTERWPDLPSAMRAMGADVAARDPALRAELGRRTAGFAGITLPPTPISPAPRAAVVSSDAPTRRTPIPATRLERPASRLPLVVGLLGGVAVLGVAGVMLRRSGAPSPDVAATAPAPAAASAPPVAPAPAPAPALPAPDTVIREKVEIETVYVKPKVITAPVAPATPAAPATGGAPRPGEVTRSATPDAAQRPTAAPAPDPAAEIRATLDRYAASFSARDTSAIRALVPALPAPAMERLGRLFASATELAVTSRLDSLSSGPDGSTVAHATLTYDIGLRGRPLHRAQAMRGEMQRGADGRWVIGALKPEGADAGEGIVPFGQQPGPGAPAGNGAGPFFRRFRR